MKTLFSRQRGNGEVMIFIHGFPFHQGIWDNFAEKFIDANTVVTIDLPGFGKSPILPDGFTIDDVAENVLQFMDAHKLSNAILVGHSLGGYVSLAMIDKKPELFQKLIMFHSTAYADSDERKESRNKVVEFVKKNGALAFTTSFIGPLFSDPQHEDIELVKQIAATTDAETIIGYTKAMRDRPERIKTLKNFKKPTLFLAGDKDPGIPATSVVEQSRHCQKGKIHILKNVAHMGMFEKSVESVAGIKDFLKKT